MNWKLVVKVEWARKSLNKNAFKSISLACRLEITLKMRRQLIVHETGYPRLEFFTSYFIDGRVFFRIFAFYSVLDDLFLN